MMYRNSIDLRHIFYCKLFRSKIFGYGYTVCYCIHSQYLQGESVTTQTQKGSKVLTIEKSFLSRQPFEKNCIKRKILNKKF